MVGFRRLTGQRDSGAMSEANFTEATRCGATALLSLEGA
jgi:hypothetical protein